MGGAYPDAVQFLQQASARAALASRLACDALPSEADGRGTIHEEASARSREIQPDADEASKRAREIDADETSDATASAREARAGGSS